MIFRRDSRLCDLCGRRGAGRALEEEEIKFVLGLYDSTPAPRVDVRLCGKCHITYNNIELGKLIKKMVRGQKYANTL